MPWLRKNDINKWFLRDSTVRMVSIPASRKFREMASISALPTPPSRASGSTESANTQPQGAEPNSRAGAPAAR